LELFAGGGKSLDKADLAAQTQGSWVSGKPRTLVGGPPCRRGSGRLENPWTLT